LMLLNSKGFVEIYGRLPWGAATKHVRSPT